MDIENILNSYHPPVEEEYNLNYEDFKKFFWKYKWLIKERERNNDFWSSTNDNLKISYEKLDEKDRELARAYDLNKKYLDNIKEGLLLINPDYIIQDEYSKYLIGLLEREDIAGLNLVDLFYPDKKKNKEERTELLKFLDMLFSNTLAEFEMIMSVNPLRNKILKIKTSDDKEKEIIIDVDFIRVYGDDSNIVNMMLIFEDKTDLVKIQNEIKYEKDLYVSELESISAIFKAGPQIFKEFTVDLKNVVADFSKNIDKLKKKKIIDHLFRQIHSLKGSAKYLELEHIAIISHEIEDKLSQLKSDHVHFRNSLVNEIHLILKRLEIEIENMSDLTDKVESFSEKIMQHKSAGNEGILQNFLSSLEDMVGKISAEMGKEIVFKIENSISELNFLKDIKNSVIHVVRNSISHGIEDKYQRLIKSKPMEGNIKVKIFEKSGSIYIEVEDDGGGIDFDKVKEKALELGIISGDNVTKGQLGNILFHPSFSSRSKIDAISGRGFGLNIVKDEVSKLNGKISISTKKDKGTKFTLKMPVQS